MTYVLRGYFRSSASWRVRLALHLKGQPFEYVPVHLLRGGGEQHGEDHRRLNPMEQLPVLLLDGVPLTQSVAILEFLDERHPDPPLLPREPFARARARALAEIVNSGVQPLQNLEVMQRLGATFGADRPAQLAWSRSYIARGLKALESLVAGASGRCMVGDEISVADICLVPQLYNARRFAVDLDACPTLLAIEARLVTLPAFIAAHPDNQPDFEP
jgi:maleylpyruvate isomerase